MTQNHPNHGRFTEHHTRYVLAVAALIAAAVTGGGPEYAAVFFGFGQQLCRRPAAAAPTGRPHDLAPHPPEGEA
ncbi:hypothetical protein [Streptomyces violaceusniger]|uniref:hypothetical protein n=1 Tax=Streptomyces violaceusniger TaxID=68280 RepID=UPI003819944D